MLVLSNCASAILHVFLMCKHRRAMIYILWFPVLFFSAHQILKIGDCVQNQYPW
ncbi:F-box domain-containing protein [Psidium guajava]|nr:F-box domain-containing protein [Psidium guajava]